MEEQISPIQELAEKFVSPAATPEAALAVELMKVWGKNDPSSSVAQYPFSYVATFADCAKAALAWSRKYLAEEVRTHATGYPFSIDYSDGITDAANIVEGNFPPARRGTTGDSNE